MRDLRKAIEECQLALSQQKSAIDIMNTTYHGLATECEDLRDAWLRYSEKTAVLNREILHAASEAKFLKHIGGPILKECIADTQHCSDGKLSIS